MNSWNWPGPICCGDGAIPTSRRRYDPLDWLRRPLHDRIDDGVCRRGGKRTRAPRLGRRIGLDRFVGNRARKTRRSFRWRAAGTLTGVSVVVPSALLLLPQPDHPLLAVGRAIAICASDCPALAAPAGLHVDGPVSGPHHRRWAQRRSNYRTARGWGLAGRHSRGIDPYAGRWDRRPLHSASVEGETLRCISTAALQRGSRSPRGTANTAWN